MKLISSIDPDGTSYRLEPLPAGCVGSVVHDYPDGTLGELTLDFVHALNFNLGWRRTRSQWSDLAELLNTHPQAVEAVFAFAGGWHGTMESLVHSCVAASVAGAFDQE